MNLNELALKAIRGAIQAGKAVMDIYQDDDFEIELKSDQSPLTKADKLSHILIENQLIDSGIPILSEEGKSIEHRTRKQWKQYWLVDPLDGTKEFIKRNGEFTVNIALMDANFPVAGAIYAPVFHDLYFAVKDIGSFKINLEKESAFNDLHQIIEMATPLPNNEIKEHIVVASRSHASVETQAYIESLRLQASKLTTTSKGSSLKLCLVAEGKADIYPRFAPTMEWDIAAGHAIVIHSGGKVVKYPEMNPLEYNKEDLVNPWFLAISKKNKFKI